MLELHDTYYNIALNLRAEECTSIINKENVKVSFLLEQIRLTVDLTRWVSDPRLN